MISIDSRSDLSYLGVVFKVLFKNVRYASRCIIISISLQKYFVRKHFVPEILSLKYFVPEILSLKYFVPKILSWKHFVPEILSLKYFVPEILSLKHFLLDKRRFPENGF